ncbi:UNVERIFIED_CONTAM: hypothetical protein HHA_207050 [Hammondia hammondi]|eukprot:XP_008888809.1 hypothetical protein HHA_207050 [Hammondia hammondi]
MGTLERPPALPRCTQSSPLPRKGLAAFLLFVLSTVALFGASAFAQASRPFRSASDPDPRTPPTGTSSAALSAGGKPAVEEAGAGEENEHSENAVEAAGLGHPLIGFAATGGLRSSQAPTAAQSLEGPIQNLSEALHLLQGLPRETENYTGDLNREFGAGTAAHPAPPPADVTTGPERRTPMHPGLSERQQRLERPLPKVTRRATPRHLPRIPPVTSSEYLRRIAKFTRSARERAAFRNVCVSVIVAAGILAAIMILNEASAVSASAEAEASEEKEAEVEELQSEEHVEPETPKAPESLEESPEKTPEAPAPQTSETEPGEATPEVALSGIRGRLAEALNRTMKALEHPNVVAATQLVRLSSQAIYAAIQAVFEVLETVAANRHLQALGTFLLDFTPLMMVAVQRLASAIILRSGSAAYESAPKYYAKVKEAINKKKQARAKGSKQSGAIGDRFFPQEVPDDGADTGI